MCFIKKRYEYINAQLVLLFGKVACFPLLQATVFPKMLFKQFYRRGGYMARGKKTPPEVIYAVMTSWAITRNYKETSEKLNVPYSTVEKIVKDNKDLPEFVKLCDEKATEFADKASKIIDKAMNRLERDIDDEGKPIPVNHLTNVIGVLIDKKLLIEGKPTARTEVVGDDKLSKLAELAGYERKQQ